MGCPGSGRVAGDAEQVDPSGAMLDDERCAQALEPRRCPRSTHARQPPRNRAIPEARRRAGPARSARIRPRTLEPARSRRRDDQRNGLGRTVRRGIPRGPAGPGPQREHMTVEKVRGLAVRLDFRKFSPGSHGVNCCPLRRSQVRTRRRPRRGGPPERRPARPTSPSAFRWGTRQAPAPLPRSTRRP